jgi:pimeloyl-ACP methyl ester carboxylesterase
VRNATTKQSKIEEILEKVQALLTEHPNYKVYVAGHSLGGALSLVFAMEAASKLVTKQPVTCIVLGNPRTGNLAFRQVMHVSFFIFVFDFASYFIQSDRIFFLRLVSESRRKGDSVACAFITILT